MNSISDVWNSILDILQRDLTSTAINTWFSDCTPVEISDSKLIIHTASEFKRDIIIQRFSSQIKSALSDIFSYDFDLLVIVGDEIDSYKKKLDSSLPNMSQYTFDRFIVGESNEFAHAAAIAVSQNPGQAYNPLFIYGNSGLGKTHLLLAIGQAIQTRDPGAKIAYVKGDEFTNDMVASIKVNTQEEFRHRYRYADLFLIDDIQFIAGKYGVQEEFFHTFNALFEAGSQIVLTSDRPPIEIHALEARLRSRFEGGLMADVQPPNLETRIAITNNKAAQLGLVLSEEVVEFISETLTANIRQIEGVVNRLSVYNDLNDRPISVQDAKKAIKDVIRTGAYIPTPEVIVDETSRYFSLNSKDIRGQRRSKDIAKARQIAMYLLRTLTNLGLSDIGVEFENRNHSTVLSSVRKVEFLIRTDTETAAVVRDITSNINSRN